jgi:hypothetical protein
VIAEARLTTLGLALPELGDVYRVIPSGAKYASHLAVSQMLYLSGTVPIKDGAPHLPGVVGADRSPAEGYEAARYAALTSLAPVLFTGADVRAPLLR